MGTPKKITFYDLVEMLNTTDVKTVVNMVTLNGLYAPREEFVHSPLLNELYMEIDTSTNIIHGVNRDIYLTARMVYPVSDYINGNMEGVVNRFNHKPKFKG